MGKSWARLRYACYTSNITMSVVASVSPVLFLTFHTLYGVSFSLLGTLVLVNFATQLTVDLLFSFFAHKFNAALSMKLTPIIAIVGFLLFALAPVLTPDLPYVGLLIGTIVFSAASGLNEVLASPIVAAIPSPSPDKEVSKLHAVYAWGVVGVVLVSTLFLWLFGRENWQWLLLLLSAIPALSFFLFCGVDIPEIAAPQKAEKGAGFLKNKGVWLCVIGIFLGGAAEVTMAGWASTYLEEALGIEKIWGDIFGVAMFSVAEGVGRTLYTKIGKNVHKALVFGAAGAATCYFVAAFSPFPVVGLIGCAFTGFCVSMLWPGSLIVSSSKFPSGGVIIYALMAAGGDLGASLGPQLVGVVVDVVSALPSMQTLALQIGLTASGLGMRIGLLIGGLFPLAAVFVFWRLKSLEKKKSPLQSNGEDKEKRL